MFAPYPVLRQQLTTMIRDRAEQGRDVGELEDQLLHTPDNYEQLANFAARIDNAPPRADWDFVEPSRWDDIVAEQGVVPAAVSASGRESEYAARARSGFLGSVVGCIIGKPVEIMPTMTELRDALAAIGEWPLNNYIPERIRDIGGLRDLHPDYPESVRENIQWVTADDDINYTLLGMMTLEKFGTGFSKEDLRRMWLENIPLGFTWGPERGFLTKQGLMMGVDDNPLMDLEAIPETLNPNSELCGAMIRADAYGYAAPGDPQSAAAMAWRDASMTHRGNGIYGAMFAAAAIALAFAESDWRVIAEGALSTVPQRSRFAEIVRDSISHVANAASWDDAYEQIHGRYSQYGHCRIFQETGTLINTLRFATDVGTGVCIQVSQGNDTDSYGATVGAILGVKFGPGHLANRWLVPFNDIIHTRLAGFYELSLNATADRIAALPGLGQNK
jgi:ADP-ribosylglycohydrolase